MKNLRAAIILGLSILFSIQSFAQDAGLSIQGVLKTIENTALENGDYSLTFKLYNVASGGTALWSETQEEIALRGGIYSAILGDVNPLNIPFDEKYYLGVSVEGGAELFPRAELTSSPYALSLIGEDNVFPNSGNVGVGDPNPAYKLTVKDGYGKIGLALENADYTTTLTGKQYEVNFNNNADKDYTFSKNGGERVRIENDGLRIRGDGEATIWMNGQSGSAVFGFTDKNSSIMNLHNQSGEIRLTSTLNRFTGDVFVYDKLYVNDLFSVTNNGTTMTLKGTDHSFLAFHPTNANREAYVGFPSGASNAFAVRNERTGGDLNMTTQDGHIRLNAGGSNSQVYVEDRLNVSGHLQVSGSAYYGVDAYDYLTDAGVGYNNGSSGFNFSIWTSGNIRADAFYADSDRRIKKDLQISDRQKDLSILNQLEVTDYRHIDEVTNGSEMKKGLIAQQVASVFSEAVSITESFIPNIFSFPTAIKTLDNKTQITLATDHDLVEGDNVKIVSKTGEAFFMVIRVVDAKTFAIETKPDFDAGKIFVYGKEVKDFHTVDYDRVFTLCVSAVQELSNQVDSLKKENTQLKTASSKTENELRAEVQSLSDRMKAMEEMYKDLK